MKPQAKFLKVLKGREAPTEPDGIAIATFDEDEKVSAMASLPKHLAKKVCEAAEKRSLSPEAMVVSILSQHFAAADLEAKSNLK